MRLLSWNVNGLRSVCRKGALKPVLRLKPDILCFQETKACADDFIENPLPGYQGFWNSAEKRGYSGVAVFSRHYPLSVVCGMGIAKHDQEGRFLTLEFPDWFLVNVYTPNAKRGLERLPYRQLEWDVDFCRFLKRLERKKPVLFCGDLNVAHTEKDLANPRANRRNHGFTDEERAGFDRFIREGFVDTFRLFCDEGGHYTWWSRMHHSRERNIGWRIDYFLASGTLKRKIRSSVILSEIPGSDHCPVMMDID